MNEAFSSNSEVSGTRFVETDGKVVIEAEDYTNKLMGTGIASTLRWEKGEKEGIGYVYVVPASGLNVGDRTIGPRLDYAIKFKKTGEYYVWIRLKRNQGASSLHAGLNESAASLRGYGIKGASEDWGWTNRLAGHKKKSRRVAIDVPNVGIHTFNIWLRADGKGIGVDKILLTQDSSFKPESSN